MKKPIMVWAFHDAPKKYQRLSKNGGDEDWIALVPVRQKSQYIGWLQSGTAFGVCSTDEHKLPTGETIYIGVHS